MPKVAHFAGLQLLAQLGLFNPDTVSWIRDDEGRVHTPDCILAPKNDPVLFDSIEVTRSSACTMCDTKYLRDTHITQEQVTQAQRLHLMDEAIARFKTLEWGEVGPGGYTPVLSSELGQNFATWMRNKEYIGSHPELDVMYYAQLDQLLAFQEKHKVALKEAQPKTAEAPGTYNYRRVKSLYFNNTINQAQIDELSPQTTWLHFKSTSFVPTDLLAYCDIVNAQAHQEFVVKTNFLTAASTGVHPGNVLAIGDEFTDETMIQFVKLAEANPQWGLLNKMDAAKALQASLL